MCKVYSLSAKEHGDEIPPMPFLVTHYDNGKKGALDIPMCSNCIIITCRESIVSIIVIRTKCWQRDYV